MVRLVVDLRKAAQMGLFARGGPTHVAPHVRRTDHGLAYVRAFDRKAGRGHRSPPTAPSAPPTTPVRPARDGGDWFKLVAAADLHGQIDHPEIKRKLAAALAGDEDLDEAIAHAHQHLRATAPAPPPPADRRTLSMFGGTS